jgi:predicted transcriptional regulator
MRTKLLLSLYNIPKNLDDLRRDLTKPSATILHGLKELETINLVKKAHKCYELTSNGYLLTTNMIKLIENWYALGKSEHFWDDHDLSDLPEDVLKNVYLLKDANYINSTTSDLSLAFNHYIKAISKSSELRIILPIYSENHFKHIIDLLNNGKLEKLELIISEEIFNSISCNKLFKEKLIDNMNVKITVIKRRIKIFLTYSKEFMSLTLFFKDGHYDDSQILIAEDENAKKWASSLWNNYRKNYDTIDQCYVS